MHRRTVCFGAIGAAGALLVGGKARAVTQRAFSQAAFEAAQQAGSPILVDVSAVWCPICTKQKPILAKLTASDAFKNLVVFDVDFDSQKDVVRALDVRMQSTLIVFHGAVEKARSVGETREDAIAALLARASS